MSTVQLKTEELTGLMKQFEEQYASLTNAMPPLAEILVAAVDEQFMTEGGGKWPKLAPETIARRRANGKGARILQDTGNMAASVKGESGNDFAEAFTNVPYVVYHVSDKPRHVIPYRNPFDIDTNEVLDEACDMFLRMLIPPAA